MSFSERLAIAIDRYWVQNGKPPRYISVKRKEWIEYEKTVWLVNHTGELMSQYPILFNGIVVIFKEDTVRIK
jgi:hypothetical protein